MVVEVLLELPALPVVAEPPVVLLLLPALPVVLVWVELLVTLMLVFPELPHCSGGVIIGADEMVVPVSVAVACMTVRST